MVKDHLAYPENHTPEDKHAEASYSSSNLHAQAPNESESANVFVVNEKTKPESPSRPESPNRPVKYNVYYIIVNTHNWIYI